MVKPPLAAAALIALTGGQPKVSVLTPPFRLNWNTAISFPDGGLALPGWCWGKVAAQ